MTLTCTAVVAAAVSPWHQRPTRAAVVAAGSREVPCSSPADSLEASPFYLAAFSCRGPCLPPGSRVTGALHRRLHRSPPQSSVPASAGSSAPDGATPSATPPSNSCGPRRHPDRSRVTRPAGFAPLRWIPSPPSIRIRLVDPIRVIRHSSREGCFTRAPTAVGLALRWPPWLPPHPPHHHAPLSLYYVSSLPYGPLLWWTDMEEDNGEGPPVLCASPRYYTS